jgi:hypothetical protein
LIETLAARVNGDAALVRKGRFVDATVLLEVGETAWLIQIVGGRIASVVRGPFVMPTWTFAMRAPAEAWSRFWALEPEPGFHDLFALIKQRLLTVEGDLHPFMANLFYFKGVFAAPRAVR